MIKLRPWSVVVPLVLATFGTAAAQTVPHQSSQRVGIGGGLGQTDLPRGGVFEPRLEAALQYAANIELAADGEPQIDTAGLEITPGLYASYAGNALVGAIDYSLIGRFWEDSDFDDVSHSLDANGEWLAIQDWFSLRGNASYTDSVIDPRNGLNYGGLGIFGGGNLAEVAAASVSPVLQHRFNSLEMLAQYSYGRTWYLDEGKGLPVVGFVTNQDSTDQSAYASLGTADDDAKLSARVFYEWQDSEFEDALPYRFERAGLDAGVRISRAWMLIGDVGRESDLDASTTEGGLDSDFWSAGLRWNPNERTAAEARYGERYFGNSYDAKISHRARYLEFTASYSEQPTVETRTLSLPDFTPGELPPGLPGVGVGRVNSSPYVAKDARVQITAVGSRTRVSVDGFQLERDYIRNQGADEKGTGAGLLVTRQMASDLSLDFDVSYSDYERAGGVLAPDPFELASDYDTQAILRLNHATGAHLTLSGETGYLTRSGTTDYDGWWAALRARWTP